MKYVVVLTLVALTFSACSSSGASAPTTSSAPIATTTTVEPTTTTPAPTTTTSTTTTSTTTVASTAPPTIPAAPAETDTEAWAAIIDALLTRSTAIGSNPAEADPTTVAEPGSAAFNDIEKGRAQLVEAGQHVANAEPERVESIESVTRMDDGSYTIELTVALSDRLGQIVEADGTVVHSFTREDFSETLVVAPYDDPELPWRVRQILP